MRPHNRPYVSRRELRREKLRLQRECRMTEREARRLLGSTEEDHVPTFREIISPEDQRLCVDITRAITINTNTACMFVHHIVRKVKEAA